MHRHFAWILSLAVLSSAGAAGCGDDASLSNDDLVMKPDFVMRPEFAMPDFTVIDGPPVFQILPSPDMTDLAVLLDFSVLPDLTVALPMPDMSMPDLSNAALVPPPDLRPPLFGMAIAVATDPGPLFIAMKDINADTFAD